MSCVPFFEVRRLHALDDVQGEIDAAVLRATRSGWYTLGPELDAFEAEFAAYCENAHCVGTGNGLSALELALRAHGVGPGDDVLVPSHTFIATWLAVSATGARPVPVEPAEDGFLLDTEQLGSAVTARTRAVIPVHLYGHPVDLDAVGRFAARHGLAVVEDAAQAHGARHRGRRVGSGNAVAFSFYPGKNLGALGDGGAVVTDDPALADRLRLHRNYGAQQGYDHRMQGTNSRLDEVQAAALRVKLRHLDDWNARRDRVASRYTAALAGVPGIVTPDVAPWAEHAWHQYVVRITDRDAVQARLSAAGVETRVHYPVAVHRTPAYAEEGFGADGGLPRAERLAAEVLSLPVGPYLSDEAVDTVTEALGAVLAPSS
ncbi:DegT/DnrJ/EryC1/StrS family aminotransferase [Streptomyces sp. RKND-216]|uniref:DegT/DnrJ/EryC1/StrS family aminotransferase n=1 Tax=Streptomyces sp. RKND-216 TaxID=2562581 RepID=UPI001B34FF85|nr:DegT/DnrJ/EryC1/StrS family aminotransferase [Streptomyces sp. RKND-216]